MEKYNIMFLYVRKVKPIPAYTSVNIHIFQKWRLNSSLNPYGEFSLTFALEKSAFDHGMS